MTVTFDMSTLRTVASGLRFPEGPIALDDGSVLVVEIEGGSVARIAPDGAIERFDCGGGPNGQALGPDGKVYVGNDGGLLFKTEDGIRSPYTMREDNPGGSVQRLDLESGAVTTVFTDSGGARLGGLNDMVFDATGHCYIVDTFRGLIHYADPVAGTIEVAAQGLAFPNGAGLSPDGSILYVSETFNGRVHALDVQAPGKLADPRLFYAPPNTQFDGLAIDGAGNICVANLTGSGITVISPAGELLGAFVTPVYDSSVTNICFGGPAGNTAYICSSGRGLLYAITWPWPGLRLHFAR